jgi:hypothetical protein
MTCISKSKKGLKTSVIFFAVFIVVSLSFLGCVSDSKSSDATIKILTPSQNGTVTGSNVFVSLKTTHFTFGGAQALLKSSAVEGSVTGGHIHVYLDKPAGLDADAIRILSVTDTVTLTGVAAGWHYIIVQGALANHDDVESMIDSVKFMVNIP